MHTPFRHVGLFQACAWSDAYEAIVYVGKIFGSFDIKSKLTVLQHLYQQ
jgi:hypothetical protein